MGLLLVLPIAALGCWIIVATFRRLIRQRVGRSWWRQTALLAGLGLGLGIWLAFFAQYQPTPRYRLAGFPIPAAIQRLENDRWVEADLPASLRAASRVTDFIFGPALALMPVGVAAWFRELRQRLDGAREAETRDRRCFPRFPAHPMPGPAEGPARARRCAEFLLFQLRRLA